jgi:hypothetical protein
MPLAVVAPIVISGLVGQTASSRWIPDAIALLAGPLLLLIWHPRLLTGTCEMPRRTFVGLAMLTLLTVLWFVGGWGYGLQSQGLDYVIAVALANGLALYICWRLAIDARRKVSFEATLFAHASVALWLTWMAFPWLGELP